MRLAHRCPAAAVCAATRLFSGGAPNAPPSNPSKAGCCPERACPVAVAQTASCDMQQHDGIAVGSTQLWALPTLACHASCQLNAWACGRQAHHPAGRGGAATQPLTYSSSWFSTSTWCMYATAAMAAPAAPPTTPAVEVRPQQYDDDEGRTSQPPPAEPDAGRVTPPPAPLSRLSCGARRAPRVRSCPRVAPLPEGGAASSSPGALLLRP